MSNNHQTICCLNPQCTKPENQISVNFCVSCGQPIIKALRQHYRPIKLLSDEGGFGRTYLAEDTDKLNQLCVIKQFAPQVSGSSALKKAQELFEQETQQLQQIGEHPQIPSLLAYFEENNYLYLIQQYIPGITLFQELIKQKKTYNETEIRAFLRDILPVLKFIHDQKIIHRDIKPANIMRLVENISQLGGKVGQYVLIDFGASKNLPTTVVKTATQIGTSGYSPREQLLEGKAYPSSDLYSLGATCFYLLTQVEPYTLFVDNGYGWVDQWQKYLSQTISNELILVITKLLNKDYQNRYQSADEVIAAMIKPEKQNQVTTLLGGIGLEMVAIPEGNFMMGSPDSDRYAYDNEKPQHQVTVSSFYLGKYPVTNAQWYAVMGTNPASQYGQEFQGSDQPVVGVTWDDAVKFCQTLSQATGKSYRLPSEAEWEYACRASTTTRYYFGDNKYKLGDYARYLGNSKGRTVGQKKPNNWGLYDMSGNVWEWCEDYYHDSYNGAPNDGRVWIDNNDNRYRIIRGGSWYDLALICRSARRHYCSPDWDFYNAGFRVVQV
jgi:formylglycine-generating enzyme required for sulfatase activity